MTFTWAVGHPRAVEENHSFGNASLIQVKGPHMWLNLAASRVGEKDRENAVMDRDKVASEMTSAQIAEAQKLAREWKPKPERCAPENC
jgi:hypothetical protein